MSNFIHTLTNLFFKSKIGYFLSTVVIYIFFLFVYEPITLGLDMEDVTIIGTPIIIGLFVFQLIMARSVWSLAFVAHAVSGLSWAITFPLLFHWSYTKPFYFYEFANDYLLGIAIFVGITILHYIFTLPKKQVKYVALAFSVLDFLILLIPLGQIFYYLIHWHCISPPTLMAFYMTNFMESIGFLKNSIGIFGIVALFLFSLLVIWLSYLSNRNMIFVVASRPSISGQRPILYAVAFLFLSYVPFHLFPYTCIMTNWSDVRAYMQEVQKFEEYHGKNVNDLQLLTRETAAQKAPGTIIVVIGESAASPHMKVFNEHFIYDNTPWLSAQKENKNFFLFNHAYSSYVQTVPTLERALTEKNQYKDKPFIDTVSFLDVAKKAGYKTFWLSNQGMYGEYDTAISLVAKTADEAKWSHDSYMFSDKYDESLLPLLKAIEPEKSNLIVIHLMGSHIYYNDRYPSAFSKWKKTPVPDGVEAYANSILYTDWILQEIYTYAREHLDLQAMVYFSDHGESLTKSHNPDIFDFEMTKIPFFIYLSPTYVETYPETARILEKNQNAIFTNDLIYDLMSGLMQAPSNRYSEEFDISSNSYSITVNNALTMLSTVYINSDPSLMR